MASYLGFPALFVVYLSVKTIGVGGGGVRAGGGEGGGCRRSEIGHVEDVEEVEDGGEAEEGGLRMTG